MLQRTDVFIIGGGPQGWLPRKLPHASEASTFVVADGAEPPIDKACGEGLLPDAVEVLARLGCRDPLLQTDSLYKAFAFFMPS